MRTIIAGTRTLTREDTAAAVQACPWQITAVVCGEARGPDTFGREFAHHFDLPVSSHPADWGGPLGKGAGFARNEDMAHEADALLAVWDGQSPGTRHMIEYMSSLGKPVYVHAVYPQQVPAKTDGKKYLWWHAESDCAFWSTEDHHHVPCDIVDADKLPAGTVIEGVGMGVSTVRPSMDFETYSEAGFVVANGKVKGAGSGNTNGLGLVGTGVYAEHPSTEVLCLYYDLKDGNGRQGWWPGMPAPAPLLHYIANGGEFEAFNSTFEFFIWNFVCVRKYGWPPMQIEQCHCVMSMSRRWGLPGSLANASKALGAAPKDTAGKNLIQQLCRPHTPTRNRPAIRRTMATDWDKFQGLFKYCEQDVAAEDDVAARIPDLTPYEREVWLTDQRINLRGVMVDTASLDACLRLLNETTVHFTRELQQITGGAVQSAGEVAKMQAWLAGRGVRMTDMQSGTVDAVLEALKGCPLGAPADCARVLEIRKALSSANVKKLAKLRHQLNSDGRLRNQYMYCGADRTGRWSSSAADDNASNSQLQNITARGPDSAECQDCGRIFGAHLTDCPECMSNQVKKRDEWTVEAVEHALEDIRRYGFQQVQELWGSPVDLLCGCLRGLFMAKPGHKYICCDFSAVEAVALACLARCEWRIEVFRTHGKIYEMSASKITGVPFEDMMAYKKETGMHHPTRKKVGKVAELASGYGGWVGAWCAFGADKFMDEAEIKKNVLAWRAESPEIVEFWGGQFRQTGPRLSDGHPEYFGLEGAAIQAVLHPGQAFWANDISYGVHDDVLYCRLPSGRFLAYHQPRLAEVAGKWGKPNSYSLTFMGFNTNPKNGPRGWVRMETYGGRLAENVTQAVCADVQAEALVRCEKAGYSIVMHTHDEGCAEVPTDFGSVEEMCAIMGQAPEWASWWPLKAAGWEHTRYQKD